MVYFNSQHIKTWFESTDFYKKYPQLKNNNFYFINFVTDKFSRWDSYQRESRTFMNKIARYISKRSGMDNSTIPATQIPFEDYLKQICIRECYKFLVCHENDINNFYAGKYLTTLFNKPVDKILDIFDNVNDKHNANYYVRNSPLFPIVKKILDTYLIIKLAKIICMTEIFLRSDSFELYYCFKNSCGCIRSYELTIMKHISQCHKNNSNFLSQLDDPDSPISISNKKFIDSLPAHVQNTLNISIDELRFKLYTYTIELYESTKTIFTIINWDDDEIKNIIQTNKYADMKMEYGRYFLNNRRSIITTVKNDIVYLNPILNDFCNFHEHDKLIDLHLSPSKVSIHNKLVVEI